MAKLIDTTVYPISGLLPILLEDKTTKKNIIWATTAYSEMGESFGDRKPILVGVLDKNSDIIKPRIAKSDEEQQERTRKKAEVFTPVWLCNQMNNYLDEEWFGRKNVFNTEQNDHSWIVNSEKIAFNTDDGWKKYVDSRRLEITCGEAPFLVSRYDASTGDLIKPPSRRIGLLDRKMRVVNENIDDETEWLKWALRAYQSCYGYEYQGDNLLIARINFMLSFIDYYHDRWDKDPDIKILKKFANVVSWNLWQMDGLKDTVPLGKPQGSASQLSLFDELPEENVAPFCKIRDWRTDKTLVFHSLKGNLR